MRIFGLEIGRARAAGPIVSEEAAPSEQDRRAAFRGSLHRARRSFSAGATDRLVSSWTVADSTINQSLLRDLRVMRARSRDFFRNNEFGRRFAQLVKSNVVGHTGFALKVDCRHPDGQPDDADSRRIGAAYARWAKIGQYEVTGKLNETLFDQLAMLMIARDGEVLFRLVEGADRGIHKFQIQILPGHLLDEEHNRELGNGHRIRMGVEYDPLMKPVAYHLRIDSGTADMHGQATRRYERVPAKEMLHLFIAEDADQWRGVPWVFAALRAAHQLNKFDEAALVAANIGASKMGFFQQQEGAEGQPIGSTQSMVPDVGEKVVQEFTTEVSPGQFDVVPDGYQFQSFDPAYPSDAYGPFTKAVVRRIATGIGTVSYHSLSGDLTDVNFSSIRSGTLDEREAWKTIQQWYVAVAKEQVFSAWLARALMQDADLSALPYRKFDKFNAPVFTGRRWEWVDPKSDVAAHAAAVALGIKSRGEIIRESGRVPEDVWNELEAEAQRGLVIAPKGAAKDGAKPAADPPKSETQKG